MLIKVYFTPKVSVSIVRLQFKSWTFSLLTFYMNTRYYSFFDDRFLRLGSVLLQTYVSLCFYTNQYRSLCGYCFSFLSRTCIIFVRFKQFLYPFSFLLNFSSFHFHLTRYFLFHFKFLFYYKIQNFSMSEIFHILL